MIKNVVFDVGNVLVCYRWRALMDELGFPKDLQEVFAEKVFGNPFWIELDRGVIDEKDVIAKIRGEISEYGDEFDRIWDNIDRLVEPYDYAVSMIDTLRKRGFRVYLLSNYPVSMFELHTRCGRFPFLEHVDGKVVSAYVKLVKPDREIYEYLLNQYDLEVQECVFSDDRLENVEGARKVGMKGILFENYEQAWAELEEMISL